MVRIGENGDMQLLRNFQAGCNKAPNGASLFCPTKNDKNVRLLTGNSQKLSLIFPKYEGWQGKPQQLHNWQNNEIGRPTWLAERLRLARFEWWANFSREPSATFGACATNTLSKFITEHYHLPRRHKLLLNATQQNKKQFTHISHK